MERGGNTEGGGGEGGGRVCYPDDVVEGLRSTSGETPTARLFGQSPKVCRKGRAEQSAETAEQQGRGFNKVLTA